MPPCFSAAPMRAARPTRVIRQVLPVHHGARLANVRRTFAWCVRSTLGSVEPVTDELNFVALVAVRRSARGTAARLFPARLKEGAPIRKTRCACGSQGRSAGDCDAPRWLPDRALSRRCHMHLRNTAEELRLFCPGGTIQRCDVAQRPCIPAANRIRRPARAGRVRWGGPGNVISSVALL